MIHQLDLEDNDNQTGIDEAFLHQYLAKTITLSDFLLSFEKTNKILGYSYQEIDSAALAEALKKGLIRFKEAVDEMKKLKTSKQESFFKIFLAPSCLVIDILLKDQEVNQEEMKENVKYVVNNITTPFEMNQLSYNRKLIAYVLDNFLFSEKALSTFDAIIKQYSDIFDNTTSFLEYLSNLRLNLKLNDDGEIFHKDSLSLRAISFLKSLTIDKNNSLFDELCEIFSKHQESKQILFQIIENNLEDVYKTADQLQRIISKPLNKMKSKLNF